MNTRSLRSYACVFATAVTIGTGFMAAWSQSPVPQAAAAPAPMDKAIAAIRDEGMNRSQVMQTMDYLCDVIGPRLTGSPALKRANEWTRDEMTRYGMVNAHLEPWAFNGRGWTLKRFSLEVLGDAAFPVRAYPKAWSPSIEGAPVERDVVFLDVVNNADLDKYRGTLKDKIGMIPMEPASLLMERKMLRGIKQRAERLAAEQEEPTHV